MARFIAALAASTIVIAFSAQGATMERAPEPAVQEAAGAGIPRAAGGMMLALVLLGANLRLRRRRADPDRQ